MVVVRENSEGEYANVGCRLYPDSPQEMALQTSVFSRKGDAVVEMNIAAFNAGLEASKNFSR